MRNNTPDLLLLQQLLLTLQVLHLATLLVQLRLQTHLLLLRTRRCLLLLAQSGKQVSAQHKTHSEEASSSATTTRSQHRPSTANKGKCRDPTKPALGLLLLRSHGGLLLLAEPATTPLSTAPPLSRVHKPALGLLLLALPSLHMQSDCTDKR